MGEYDDYIPIESSYGSYTIYNAVLLMLRDFAQGLVKHDAHVAGIMVNNVNSAVGSARDYLDIILRDILKVTAASNSALNGIENSLQSLNSNSIGEMSSTVENINQVLFYNTQQVNKILGELSNGVTIDTTDVLNGVGNLNDVLNKSIQNSLYEYNGLVNENLNLAKEGIVEQVTDSYSKTNNQLNQIQMENYNNLNALDASIKAALGEGLSSLSTEVHTIPETVTNNTGNFLEAVKWLWEQYVIRENERVNINADKIIADYNNILNSNVAALKRVMLSGG